MSVHTLAELEPEGRPLNPIPFARPTTQQQKPPVDQITAVLALEAVFGLLHGSAQYLLPHLMLTLNKPQPNSMTVYVFCLYFPSFLMILAYPRFARMVKDPTMRPRRLSGLLIASALFICSGFAASLPVLSPSVAGLGLALLAVARMFIAPFSTVFEGVQGVIISGTIWSALGTLLSFFIWFLIRLPTGTYRGWWQNVLYAFVTIVITVATTLPFSKKLPHEGSAGFAASLPSIGQKLRDLKEAIGSPLIAPAWFSLLACFCGAEIMRNIGVFVAFHYHVSTTNLIAMILSCFWGQWLFQSLERCTTALVVWTTSFITMLLSLLPVMISEYVGVYPDVFFLCANFFGLTLVFTQGVNRVVLQQAYLSSDKRLLQTIYDLARFFSPGAVLIFALIYDLIGAGTSILSILFCYGGALLALVIYHKRAHLEYTTNSTVIDERIRYLR